LDDGGPLHFVDLSDLNVDGALARVELIREQLGMPKPGSRMPWFPVIDYDRCNNCKQCLSSCLFGVFGVDADDQVEVQNPDQCKTGCPSCSRVCPNVAIMFSKYDKGPANGDEVGEEDLRGDKVQVDVSALHGGDNQRLPEQLRRSGQRRLGGRTGSAGRALRMVRHLYES